MPTLLAYLYAALAGALTNIQVGADLKLFRGLQNPALTAVAILFAGLVVAMLALLVWSAVTGIPSPGWAAVTGIPWWAWAGGALQGLTVLAVFLTAGRAGAAVFSALTVTGGAICSLLLDQFGLVGFDQHSITWHRAIGVTLLICGTVLMAR
jgi:transporter family-2 protein